MRAAAERDSESHNQFPQASEIKKMKPFCQSVEHGESDIEGDLEGDVNKDADRGRKEE